MTAPVPPTTTAPQVPGTGFSGSSWLSSAAPYIMGALSTAGDIYSAQANRVEAERNRQFQERMSSTAVQRSVEDYRKAGLNPGLAYERSASSPGGAQATIGNPVSSGISTLQGARAQRQAMDLAAQQNQADLVLKQGQTAAAIGSSTAALASADLNRKNIEVAEQDRKLKEQAWIQNGIMNPGVAKLQKLATQIQELSIPGAENQAAYEQLIKQIRNSPGITNAKQAADMIKTYLTHEMRK